MLSRNWRHLCRRYSQAVTFRTNENSPVQHNDKQVGLFYTVKPELCKQLFGHGGLPKSFQKQTKTFTETAIMVRQPALDIIDCIKASDMNKPVVRYVLYGEKGTGKSITLAHLLHYAHEEGYLIVHVPWVSEWLRRVSRHKEMSNSQTHEGSVDLPLDAAAWLIHFKSQNQTLLKQADLKVSKEYVWSKREKTEAGTPLSALVELGINRVKYACDIIDALVDEIKILSDSKQCKTFVAIDGFNSFLYPLTRLNTPTKKKVKSEEVTLTSSFMKLTKNDWTNGAILLTADQLAVPDDHQESFFPRYLLYKKLKVSKEYVWSKREKTEAGTPLSALVELGINRVKYACDIIDALVDEIKILSDSKQCKTFVAIDGFNSFLYPLTRLNTPTKKKVKSEEVTLTSSFMKLTKNDWTNGAILLTADQLAVPDDHQESFFPRYLLYKKGFEHLDPFVPVEVSRYSDKEYLSCVGYYRDRLWLRGPSEIDEELKMTSAANPYTFMEQCAPL